MKKVERRKINRNEKARTDQAMGGEEFRGSDVGRGEVAGGESEDWRTKNRVNEMYRTFSPAPLSALERNRPGEEGKLEEDGGMGRRAGSFSVWKEMSFPLGLRKKLTCMQIWCFRALSGRDLGLQDIPLTEMGHWSICSKKIWQDKLPWCGMKDQGSY